MVQIKEPLEGVLDRSGAPTTAGYKPPGPVKGYVFHYNGHDGLYWSELEPTQGTFDSTVISTLTSELDAAEGAGLVGGIKLRILSGINAPSWLKSAYGTFVCDTSSSTTVSEDTCVNWFLPGVVAAYRDVMRRLSVLFDAHPALRDVAISVDGLQFAEPYVRKINSHITSTGSTTRVNIWNAFVAHAADSGFVDDDGDRWYTTGTSSDKYHGANLDPAWYRSDRHYGLQAADEHAMFAAVEAHNEYWVITRSSLAVNPYQVIAKGDDGVVYGNPENCQSDPSRPYMSWTLRSMTRARDLMTQRLLLGNNSIRFTEAAKPTDADDYNRTDTSYGSGWGTASGGGTYTTSAAAHARIQSNTGQVKQDSGSSERRYRHTSTSTGSTEVYADLAWSTNAAGAEHWCQFEVCVQDVSGTADGYYGLQVRELASGSNRFRWRFRKQDSTVGSATALPVGAAVDGLIGTYTTGTAVHVHFQVEALADEDVALRGNVWTGATEPSGWQIDIIDSSPDLANWAGHFAIRLNTGSGYTSTSQVWSIDGWNVAPIGDAPAAGKIGGPNGSTRYDAIYRVQRELHGPLYYQTAALSRLPSANWEDVLEWASTPLGDLTALGQAGQGAVAVELPGGYTAFTP